MSASARRSADPRGGNACAGLDAATLGAIAEAAEDYRRARGLAMTLIELAGRGAVGVLDRLPGDWQARVDALSQMALRAAGAAAAASRSRDDGPAARLVGWASGAAWHRRAVMVTGALGGAGGLPTALVELPVTTTLILRAIQGIAAERGEDPDDPAVREACLHVFSLGGPLPDDDQSETGFFAARLALDGAVRAGLPAIAGRFGWMVGQKLLAQAAPVIGAAAGAAVNLTFMCTYQTMAEVQFRLRALARQGHDPERLAACFARFATPPRRSGA